ncbi:hypothetical protein [Peribacillus frigoritolerans]|nr:hypothetical protein [Peribacillus castrilensis]
MSTLKDLGSYIVLTGKIGGAEAMLHKQKSVVSLGNFLIMNP